MKSGSPSVLILYATREGHSATIAAYLATEVQSYGATADIRNADAIEPDFSLREYSLAFLIGSVHRGQHEVELRTFVNRHRDLLSRVPTVFLSVSLSAVTAVDPAADPVRREHARADVDRMIRTFLQDTQWQPAQFHAVAGALAYTKYGFLTRIFMRWIASRAGKRADDTSHDYVYTDWKALRALVREALLRYCSAATAGDR